MKKLGIAGYSGSGKTTLLVRLLPALKARGLSASTIKHTHHNVAVDRKGDVSRALAAAGAREILIAGAARWALLHEHRDEPEAGVASLTQRMSPVDLLLVEGFKSHRHDKIEVHRPAHGKPLLCRDDPHVIAVASDQPLADLALPILDLNDVAAIAEFIVGRLGLGRG